jgi:hypothetical protein
MQAMVGWSLPPVVCKRAHNFVSHEILLKIKTGYIQTDEGGVNMQYKSNTKQKIIDILFFGYPFKIFLPVYRLCNMQMILNMYCMFALLSIVRCGTVRNGHSEDKHSIEIGILIPSTTKYINMCSILFIVPFYLIT